MPTFEGTNVATGLLDTASESTHLVAIANLIESHEGSSSQSSVPVEPSIRIDVAEDPILLADKTMFWLNMTVNLDGDGTCN